MHKELDKKNGCNAEIYQNYFVHSLFIRTFVHFTNLKRYIFALNNRRLSVWLLLVLLVTLRVMAIAQGDVKITHFTESDGFAECQASCAIQDHLGYVWIGSWNGLSRYDGYTFKTFKARPGDNNSLKTNRIRWVRELKDHNLECYTIDSCIYVFDRQSETFKEVKGNFSMVNNRFRPDKQLKEQIASLPQFNVADMNILLKDRQGGVWVRTADGLFRVYFAKKAVAPTKSRQSSSEQVVRSVYEDRQGNLWIGDKNGYVAVYDSGGKFTGYLTPQGTLTKTESAFGAMVYVVFQDSKGDIWLGTKKDGLYRLSPISEGRYKVKHFMPSDKDAYSINSNIIYDIVEDNRHRLWIATYWGGLNMYDLNTQDDAFVNNRNLLKGFPKDEESSKVHCLMISRNGSNTLLIGTHGGMYTCNLDQTPAKMVFHANKQRMADANSLGNNRVMDFCQDATGSLYVATYGGGLSVTEEKNLLKDNIAFRQYTTEQGLASDICLSVVADREGAVYVVSDVALSKLSARDSSFTYYSHGLFDTSQFRFSEVAPVLTKNNNMVFGTTQGFLRISTDDIRKSNFVPRIVFDCPSHIELSADDKSLRIGFSALDFNKNEQIVYAYKLEGVDDDWVYTKEPSVYINNMPAGTYTLHVKSTNGDGAWVDNEATLTIHRPARFNETPLAWMLYGGLLAILLFVAYKTIGYVRRLEHELNELKLSKTEKIGFYGDRLKELVGNEEKVIDTEPEEDDLTGEERDFAHKMHELIRNNINNSDLTIDFMASEIGVSRTVMYVKTKKVFNTSPNNYVLNVRMEEAMRMLRDRDARVSEVAYRVGFSDPKYFSRCFKKHTGKKPSEYQNT